MNQHKPIMAALTGHAQVRVNVPKRPDEANGPDTPATKYTTPEISIVCFTSTDERHGVQSNGSLVFRLQSRVPLYGGQNPSR